MDRTTGRSNCAPVWRRLRGRWVLLVSLVVGLAFIWVGSLQERIGTEPPVFEGRTLDQWLNQGFMETSRALHEVGPDAVPVIFAKLRREHPRFGYWQRYRSVWDKLPARVQRFLPTPKPVGFDEWRACNALIVIGPRVVPSLGAGLRDKNWLVRSTSAQALALLRERGVEIGRAFPALERASCDSHADVRLHASRALGRGS